MRRGTSMRAGAGGWVSPRRGARPGSPDMPATDGAWRSRSEGAGSGVVRQTRWTFGIQSAGACRRRMPFIRPVAGGAVGSARAAEGAALCRPGQRRPSALTRKGRALRALLPPILHAPRRAAATAWSTTVSTSGRAHAGLGARPRPHHASQAHGAESSVDHFQPLSPGEERGEKGSLHTVFTRCAWRVYL